jgi:hypothetical protein
MQSPWGIAWVVAAAVLTLLLLLSGIVALFALAFFLVRRSRPIVPPGAGR